MGVRGLEYYIKERKLSQTAPLSALAGARLGIDAKLYISNLLTGADSREPFVAATGGTNLSITQRIDLDLVTLNRHRIKPVFIFAGLPMQNAQTQKGFSLSDEKAKEDAWNMYENGRVAEAIIAFSSIKGGGATDYREVVRMVIKALRQRFVEWIVAPYLEHSQLAYLLNHPNGYIHAIYSSNEALLWPVDKVITSLDFPSSFTFVDKSRLLADIRLSSDQFLDLGIIAGCSFHRTHPLLVPEYTFRSAIEMIRAYGSGIRAMDGCNERDPVKMGGYRDEFIRTRQAIRHGFIFTTEGACLPLPLATQIPPGVTAADVPSDIDKIFSPRLPDELYFYMCKGMISPAVIGWLTTGSINETPPLSDSKDYQHYVKNIITESVASPRVLCLAILQDALHAQWKSRQINTHYYFDSPNAASPIPGGSTLSLDKPKTLELVGHLSKWAVPFAVLAEELRRQSMSTIDIKLCIGTISDPAMAKQSLQTHSKPLERKDEFVANAIWRYLTIRGFINGTDHTLSMAGQALHAALVQSRTNDKFQEPLTTIIELLRCGVLHGLYIGDAYRSGGPVGDDELNESSSMLILRCLSVLPLTFRPVQWAGPLSRELLVFNSFSRSIQKCSRQLLEVIAVHMLLSGSVKKQRDDYLELMLSLPFQSDTNTGFGILFKTYLDVTLYTYEQSEKISTITKETATSESAKQAKAEAMEFIENTFSGVKNPRQEVERGFRFWDTVMVAVRKMAELQLAAKEDDLEHHQTKVLSHAKETLEEFEIADRWLQPLKP